MKRIFLGFSGRSRHGKDSAASAIFEAFPGTKIYSISELICAELGVKRAEVQDVRILQRHSHLRCENDPLYWARQIALAVERDEAPVSVLSNVRRWDEAEFYRSQGWRLCRVTALNPDGSLYIGTNALDHNDPLETQLDRYNFEFHITARKPGQLAWLRGQAVLLANYLLEGECDPPAVR